MAIGGYGVEFIASGKRDTPELVAGGILIDCVSNLSSDPAKPLGWQVELAALRLFLDRWELGRIFAW